MKSFFLAVICLSTLAVLAEKPSMDRYQTIVDRQMFGPLPPGFDPTKSPDEVQSTSAASEKELTKEQEKLQSAVHFSVLNVDANGVPQVGFTDNSDPKVPRHYYLKVGEKKDGWEVRAADPEKATMTVVKDDIEVTLTLGGNSAQDAGATAKAGGVAAPTAGASALSARRGLLGGGSLKAIRQRRMMAQQEAAQAKASEEAAAREAARQAQAEQDKAQREAERAEQRQQLLAIQEELKRVREAKAAESKSENDAGAENQAQ